MMKRGFSVLFIFNATFLIYHRLIKYKEKSKINGIHKLLPTVFLVFFFLPIYSEIC